MTIYQSILYGVVQGLTEFIPISSSAHLVIIPKMFNWQIPSEHAFTLNVLVQLASLVAVIIYFFKDITNIILAVFRKPQNRSSNDKENVKLAWWIIIASLPAVIIGFSLKNIISQTFSNPLLSAGFLLITALLLILGERLGKKERFLQQINWKDALWIGFFQAFALFPGISRSGSTISAGLLRNVNRSDAAKFSFLMALPAMTGAGLLAIIDLIQCQCFSTSASIYIPAILSSLLISYLSIHFLLRFLKRNTLMIFVFYCIAFSILTFIIL